MQNLIKKAVETLSNGGVILLPTETVYGIAADASCKSALEKIYEIKRRDHKKPLQIMVATLAEAEKIAIFNNRALELAAKFWPGALTIILKQKNVPLPASSQRKLGSANLLEDSDPSFRWDDAKSYFIAENFNMFDDTIGIRIPNHPVALEILKKFGRPLAVTSANISGESANIDFLEAKRTLSGKLDLLIDGGASQIGISSTVIDMTDENNIKILRQGSVSV